MSAVALTTVLAHSGINSIPSNFFTVVDQQGANDINTEQSDLTQFGRDDTDVTKYKMFWSWDSINSWTGTGQTGDACALFDNDGDGKINFAACARVANVNADPNNIQLVQMDATHPVYLWSCSDSKNDRCTNPNPVSYNSPADADAGVVGTDAKANLITDTDPFAAGQSYPHDTTVEVDVSKAKIPAGSSAKVLVNVCSYPSAGNGGNNNPFDCIVTPGGGFLKIYKNAGGDTSTAFTVTVAPPPVAPQPATYTVREGHPTDPIGIAITNTASATETVPSDWNLTGGSCTKAGGSGTGSFDSANHQIKNIVIESGQVTTCTLTNQLKSGTLVVKKVVVNDNGGTKHATDFSFSVNGGTNTAFTQDTDVLHGKNSITLPAGTEFSVVEANTPISGYGTSYSGCTGTIAANTISTCTITNDDQAATLIVRKVVVNDDGGSKHATDFSFKLNGGSAVAFQQDGADVDAGKNTLTVDAGSFSVVEANLPITGYSTSSSGCSGSIANGETKTCTITNNDVAGTLIVKKVVVNDNGGSKHATDFGFELNGGSTVAFLQDGDVLHGKNTLSISAGSYSVDESSHSGYTKSLSTDCSGSIANGETRTCTITNDDQAAMLIVKKVVINDNGGSKVATDFGFSVNGGSSTAFLQDADALHGKNTLTLDAGTYDVVESGLPISGYTTTYDNCAGISLGNGASATCMITNDDQAATLVVKKVVINDNGGSMHAIDFSFSVNGAGAVTFTQDGSNMDAGKNTVSISAGSFTVVEAATPIADYDTSYSGCSGTIANGETKTCTITNDDQKFDPSGGTTMGWKINDAASFGIRAGAGNASSATIMFKVYKDADGVLDANTCTAANQVGSASTVTVTLTNSGATAGADSADFTVGTGHYFWVATYSGDAYNNSTSTACGSEVTTIQ